MEQVFCIARKELEKVFFSPLPNGALPGPPLPVVLGLQHYFIDRPIAEADPSYKQIIPYQLFCCQDRFFVYQRGGNVGEQRLSWRCSLGIGGHLNRGDSNNGRMGAGDYEAGLLREREEELHCQGEMTTRFIGWINDDSDPVGQVHLGAVHICQLTDETQVALRTGGEDIYFLGWLTFDEILAKGDAFETWSRLALELACPGKISRE